MKKNTAPKKPTTRIAAATGTVDELADFVSATTRLVRGVILLVAALGALVTATATVVTLVT